MMLIEVVLAATAFSQTSAPPSKARTVGLVCSGTDSRFGAQTRHYTLFPTTKKMFVRDGVTGKLSLPYTLRVDPADYYAERQDDGHDGYGAPRHWLWQMMIFRETGQIRETIYQTTSYGPGRSTTTTFTYNGYCKPESPGARTRLVL